MGFLTSILGQGETRPIRTSKDLHDYLVSLGSVSDSGITVTPETAMRFSTVYSCVKVISEDVGKLPLILYRRRKDGGKDRATDHPLYRIMHNRANPWMTAMSFKEMLTGHMCLRGGGYAFINRLSSGAVAELLPIHPDRVTVKQGEDWEVTYEVRRPGGVPETFRRDKIFHPIGQTLDGVNGLSPIAHQRETVGLGMAAQRFGAKVFTNGAKMGGILTTPAKFKDPKRADELAADFDAKTSGEKAHSTILLEEDMKWIKVGMTSEDAQYLETRKFQRSEIAGIFRVPPHKIGDLERATFTNIEHQGGEYVADCLLAWFVRWEQALNASLLTEAEQDKFFFEFLPDALLRGDTQARYESYRSAIESGILSPDEVRGKENYNPREDGLGGKYMRSANTVPADAPVDSTSPPPPRRKPEEPPPSRRMEA